MRALEDIPFARKVLDSKPQLRAIIRIIDRHFCKDIAFILGNILHYTLKGVIGIVSKARVV